jgi:hypothetical protein
MGISQVLTPIPATGWNFANAIVSRNNVLPILVIIVGAWKSACHPNNGDICCADLSKRVSGGQVLFYLHERFSTFGIFETDMNSSAITQNRGRRAAKPANEVITDLEAGKAPSRAITDLEERGAVSADM